MAKKPGLWANIHAKRKRIKAGSGETMRDKGDKGAPTASQMKAAQGKNRGGEFREIPKSNTGLAKLPEKVRNKMGFFAHGGKVSMHRGCGAVMSDRRKETKYS